VPVVEEMGVKYRVRTAVIASRIAGAVAALMLADGAALAAQTAPAGPAVQDGKIAYVLTHRWWATYQSKDGKEECPGGVNLGPREQFAKLFPKDGPKKTVVESYLTWEAKTWLPMASDVDPFPYMDVKGKISYGLNLDGKVKATDFVSPEGEKGIDNQMYRAAGCIGNFRSGQISPIWWYENEYVRRYIQNRFMFEISGVDSLENDDDVTVNSYRGSDELLQEAIGDEFGQVIAPGGTQRIDDRYGKFAQATWKGKIVNGVLMTEPADVQIPMMGRRNSTAIVKFRGLRFNLKLTPGRAEGLLAGYTDIDTFHHWLSATSPTYRQSEGVMSAPSLLNSIFRLADGYPDPVTGQMTAISSALNVRFAMVHIDRSPPPVASAGSHTLAAAESTKSNTAP
jgi:hypothetical protein